MLLLLFAVFSFVRSISTDVDRIQRLSAFHDLVATGRAGFVAVHRHNGTNVDLSLSLYKIARSTSSSNIGHLRLINQSKLTYCDTDACWLCYLKPNGTHHCQGYYVSRSGRKMASVECVLGDAYLTVRFVDTKGNASTVKLEISEEENSGPIYPMQQADDMEGSAIRDQSLVGSFHDDGFTYFLGSAERRHEPSCLLSTKPGDCTEYRRSIRVLRVCDADRTTHLESKTEITLSCDSESGNTALGSYYEEFNGIVTVVVGSPPSNIASICHFMLDDIVDRFKETWNICQNITDVNLKKCRHPGSHPECNITSKDFNGGFSLCRKCIDSTSSAIDVCSLHRYESHDDRHCWLENFTPLQGSANFYSLNLLQSDLVSVIEHSESDSTFVLRRFSNGSSRVDRMRGDDAGLYLSIPHVSSIRSVWHTVGIDAIPMVFDSFSKALFFSRNDSVEIQPITCRDLYKKCSQMLRQVEADPLDCVWCRTGGEEGFSLPRNVQGICPNADLFVGKCPDNDSLQISTAPESTTKADNEAPESGHELTFFLKMSGVALSAIVAVLVLLVVALRRWNKRRSSEVLAVTYSPLSQGYPLVQAPPLQGYEACGQSYLTLLQSFGKGKRINYKELAIDCNPIGHGHYGQVYKGMYKKGLVACKTVNDLRSTCTGDFLREAKAMSVLEHPRVLEFVGICFDTERHYPTILVTKYMSRGDLHNYISDKRNMITLGQLLGFGLEVAEGMEYIHSKNVIHRDLAARNCMLDDDLHVCVADFGLSRFANEEEAGYQVRTSRPLPLSTLSIEALAEGHFSTKSDVWAFGNLLWELMTRGFPPWKGVSQEDLLLRLRRGERLPLQEYWPSLIYHRLMLLCWEESPAKRPTFTETVMKMKSVFKDLSVRQSAQTENNYEVPKFRCQ